MTVKEFEKLSLHDVGFENFQFDFSKKRIILSMSFYNEDSTNYDYVEFAFSEVESFLMSETEIESFTDLEIFTHDIKINDGQKPNVQFLAKTGFGKREFTFSFSFDQVSSKLMYSSQD